MRAWLVAVALSAVSAVAAAASLTPTGLWQTLDDDGKTVQSWVRISEAGGIFVGHIEKVLDPAAKPGDVCSACSDERKGQPIIGLRLIRNMRQSARDARVFEGGDIVDPDDGKVYRLRLRLEAEGRQLEVRGYFGPFYRTQVWQRLE